jgi:hypothetical protein
VGLELNRVSTGCSDRVDESVSRAKAAVMRLGDFANDQATFETIPARYQPAEAEWCRA